MFEYIIINQKIEEFLSSHLWMTVIHDKSNISSWQICQFCIVGYLLKSRLKDYQM